MLPERVKACTLNHGKLPMFVMIMLVVAPLIAGATIANLPTLGIIIVVGTSLVLLAVSDIGLGCLLVVLWAQVQYLFTTYLGLFSHPAVWLDELLLVFVFLGLMASIVIKKRSWVRTPIDISMLSIVLLSIASSIAGSVPPHIAILSLRGLLQYVLLFYVLINSDLSEKRFKLLIGILIFISLLHIPFALTQFLSSGGVTTVYIPDVAFGLYGPGQNNLMGVYLLMTISILIGMVIYSGKRRALWMWIMILLLIPLILSMSRQSYYLLPVLLLWMFRQDLRRHLKVKFAIVVLLSGLLLGGIWLYSQVVEEGKVLDLPTIRRILDSQLQVSGNVGGRIGYLLLGYDTLQRHALSPLLGVGPGMFSSSTGVFFQPPLLRKVLLQHNALWISSHSQVTSVMTEYGFLGIFLFGILFYKLYAMNRKIFRKAEDSFWKGISMGLDACIFVFVVGAFMGNVWEVQYIAVVFWMLAGILFSVAKRRGYFERC